MLLWKPLYPWLQWSTSGIWRPSCQDGMWDDTHPAWVSFICDLGRVHGSSLGEEQKIEGIQGGLQKLHYLSSRKLRRTWAILEQPRGSTWTRTSGN